MEFSVQLHKLRHLEAKRFIFVVGLIAVTHLFFQSLTLPYGNALRSLFPKDEANLELKWRRVDRGVKNGIGLEDIEHGKELFDGRNSSEDSVTDMMINVTMEDDISREKVPILEDNSQILSLQEIVEPNNRTLPDYGNGSNGFDAESQASILDQEDSLIRDTSRNDSESKIGSFLREDDRSLAIKGEVVRSEDETEFPHVDIDTKSNTSAVKESRTRKKMPSEIPPKSVVTLDRMNQILVRHLKSPRSMKPEWASSPPDMEILEAKEKIMNAPFPKKNGDLYAPLFHNISMFVRSYELMEHTLKIYIYKDGEKPIFHQPILKGLYASEGWFMKLMEGNRHFVVKDPKKAHLFYMPFSSRMLEHTLYVPNSYDRSNLRDFVKGYSEKIAAKYPYWNRTGGMDHFLVACHDWALYETRHHMDNCIKALCNADITIGFKIGRDVSLPETFIRFERNPLRDIGGKPPSERSILAFYSGNNHGYLRPTLLDHWKDRYPDMKIYGLMPRAVAKRMSYIKHMKSSKYCLCPKGFEVNSPRIIEAIYYECVPVIISDNFVPPFFEVLNWEAFSVIVAEKDVPRLREILMSIPEERYQGMQFAVKKVQRHFLWHARPLKYDLFHMTLHSIWYNRIFQTRPKMRT